MAETFVISRGAADEAEVVVVEIRHDGVTGYGEANPIERYDESAASALAFLEDAEELLGDDPFALEAIEGRFRARPGEHVGQRSLRVTADTYTHVLVDESELDYADLLA